MDFFYYDLIFLIVFCIAVAIFLYRRRKRLQREGVFFLYRTKYGLKIIEKVSKSAPKLLNYLSYISIGFGYLIMIVALAVIIQSLSLMLNMVTVPKIPPIMPLIPYFPRIFKISFLPPFYFSYWIIIIFIAAVCHEFAHGIFARFNKIKIKSTGFGFLGPFLAAFVELDEKQMATKKKVKPQLAILSAGSFANLIIAIIFFLILQTIFSVAYAPAGVIFNSYTLSSVNITDIDRINNISIDSPAELQEIFSQIKNETKNITEKMTLEGKNNTYFITIEALEYQLKALKEDNKNNALVVFEDSPACRAGLEGAIKKIRSEEPEKKSFDIKSIEQLQDALSQLKPKQEVIIETTEANYSIKFGENPLNKSRAYLGIGFYKPKINRLTLFVASLFRKDQFVHYEPKQNKELTTFIYDLVLWLVIINFSIMLINMLPFTIFDGGRFFYLTILGITKDKKKAINAFKIASFIILLLLFMVMLIWWLRLLSIF